MLKYLFQLIQFTRKAFPKMNDKNKTILMDIPAL